MWRELVARYAILAREFSEEVALLGKEAYLGPEASRDRLAAIRTKHDLCVAAAGQVDDYLNQTVCSFRQMEGDGPVDLRSSGAR
jgi:hypothetical protein